MQNLFEFDSIISSDFIEKKAFVKSLLQRKTLRRQTLTFFLGKVGSRFARKLSGNYGTSHYPEKINQLVEQLINSGSLTNFEENELDGSWKTLIAAKYIRLASQDLEILNGQIPWSFKFVDQEDEVSLHRWNWMLFEISKGPQSQCSLDWLLAMQEDWIALFQHEVDLPKYKLDQLLRWEPYTISERLANSVLLFHLHNCVPNPAVVKNLFLQTWLLSSRIEYLGKQTCNHVCNNARGLYLVGAYFGSENLCSLAREIFFNELPILITGDGFLREGSSHYQFLFTRWMLEVHYFARRSLDDALVKFIEPILQKLLRQCEFFVVKTDSEVVRIPLFGDISPDFPPGWLLSLPAYLSRGLQPHAQVDIPTWQNLFANVFDIRGDDHLFRFDVQSLTKSLSYPKSGWFRFDHASFIMFIRCDMFGVPSSVGHHHQDAGHFCLFYQGEPILVDSGRLNYTEEFGVQPEAHNTITINGFGSIPRKSHRFPRDYANCKQTLTHEHRGDTLFLKFTTNGFSRLYPNLFWSREWQLEKNKVLIKDSLEGSDNKKFDIRLFFHFSASTLINQKMKLWEGNCRGMPFVFDVPTKFFVQRHCGSENSIGWQVHEYGKSIPSPTLELLTNNSLPAIFQSSLRFT